MLGILNVETETPTLQQVHACLQQEQDPEHAAVLLVELLSHENTYRILYQALGKSAGILRYVHSVEFSEEIPTADCNIVTGRVHLGVNFFLEYMKTLKDLVFVLLHERNHYLIRVLKLAVKRDFTALQQNLFEDVYINGPLWRMLKPPFYRRFYSKSEGLETILHPNNKLFEGWLTDIGYLPTHYGTISNRRLIVRLHKALFTKRIVFHPVDYGQWMRQCEELLSWLQEKDQKMEIPPPVGQMGAPTSGDSSDFDEPFQGASSSSSSDSQEGNEAGEPSDKGEEGNDSNASNAEESSASSERRESSSSEDGTSGSAPKTAQSEGSEGEDDRDREGAAEASWQPEAKEPDFNTTPTILNEDEEEEYEESGEGEGEGSPTDNAAEDDASASVSQETPTEEGPVKGYKGMPKSWDNSIKAEDIEGAAEAIEKAGLGTTRENAISKKVAKAMKKGNESAGYGRRVSCVAIPKIGLDALPGLLLAETWDASLSSIAPEVDTVCSNLQNTVQDLTTLVGHIVSSRALQSTDIRAQTAFPYQIGRREVTMMGTGYIPTSWSLEVGTPATKVPLYVDVSGSMVEWYILIPWIIQHLKERVGQVYHFSNSVIECSPDTQILLTTHGTSFSAVARSILDNKHKAAIILTDNCGNMHQDEIDRLKSENVEIYLISVMEGYRERGFTKVAKEEIKIGRAESDIF